ncbi:hypothetical protein HU200_007526 [Digitaria exilis]|uniref:Reverse transcriptase zinc-binding domain-containing protein n=1 Tax=Digitaria exilis TaxID=1010633 RepID=A0A835FMM8_9POAL|nr:hypothetical protein HU200_007526 [Digitaria exilis]
MVLLDYSCVLCTAIGDETLAHLFIQCLFAQRCWQILNLHVSSPDDRIQTMVGFSFFHGCDNYNVVDHLDGKK